VIESEQGSQVGDGWCYLPASREPNSLDWLSQVLTVQIRDQGRICSTDRIRATSWRKS
jgi:hypothetical protein